MSWQSLIKPPGKDPKNINEWLALITEKIRELKQTENWYDVSRVVMTTSIVDNLESHRDDAILSANQGRTLKELIDTLETKVDDLVEGLNTDISEINGLLDENIPKLNSSIESIAQLTTRLNQLSSDVSKNSEDIETINNTLIELTNDISDLENSLNVISDRINKNNETITNRVSTLETKIDQNLEKINKEIVDISNDMGVLVGGNEILSGLNINISSENVITTSVGKVLIKGEVIDINTQLSITVTPDMLNRDYILLITLKLNEDKEPILALVETLSSDEVLIAKLSIIDGVINSNSKMNELQPINTMIGLAADNEADTVRETIPSGFTTLGGLDYEYMLNNENVVKLKSESVAYVNGYKVVIPKDTVINIGKAPEKDSREDLLFLEVWKDEDFPKTGKVKWRIRHVADVDFNKYSFEGFATNSTIYDWVNGNPSIQVQGGLISPTDYWLGIVGATSWSTMSMRHHTSNQGLKICLDDPCIFIAGLGDMESKTQLKTLDGYVYAIPMFRLYRKPSCGKSIPFEYSKLNPKVEYSKFSKLMKEEKVERAHTENIKGRSLVNLARRDKTFSLTLRTGDLYNSIKICDTCLLKLNTPYTLVYSINVLSDTTGNNLANLNHGGQFGLSTEGDDTTNHPSIIDSDKNGYSFDITNLTVKVCKTFIDFKGLSALTIRPILPPTRPITGTITYELCNLMLLEGDWTNKEIPEFFTGLKSLGEDDGNLITIKNGILDDNTYDVNDGNQKLTTFPNTTHLLSDNVMIPKVEAVVKKGDQETPLEKLGTKLETDGTEIVEFTKIKGRTLQNIITNVDWIINSSKDTAYMMVDWSLLKPDTAYTYYIYNLSSKVNRTNGFVGANFTQPPNNDLSRPILINSVSNLEGVVGTLHPHVYGTDFVSTDFTNTKIIILEGDYTNTPLEELPFVEGIKSVGETENKVVLSSVGKNLFDVNHFKEYINELDSSSGLTTIVDGEECFTITDKVYNKVFYMKGKFKENTSYTLSGKAGWGLSSKQATSLNFVYTDGTICTTSLNTNEKTLIEQEIVSDKNKTIYYIWVTYWHPGTGYFVENSIMLRETDTSSTHEEYKKYTQEVHLKEPLRSLPNGVCDELLGNRLIRRVGKTTYIGSENWVLSKTYTNDKYGVFAITNGLSGIIVDNVSNNTNLLCDKFKVSTSLFGSSPEECTIVSGTETIWFCILKSRLPSVDEAGFKTWLSQNPTTVYYELLNPIEEYLENVYDKESIKTYQLDAPLRSIPNGVKDEIKDGVLIRRCGEVILDDTKNIKSVHLMNDGNTVLIIYAFKTHIIGNTNLNNNTKILADKFNVYLWTSDFDTNYTEGIVQGGDEDFYVKIPKSKLSSLDSTGWKAWLKENPIKIVYALDTPIEIPLTETKPQTANFSIQRQFVEGNWLRELPSGVKDTVERGKVIRRTKKFTLTGSESDIIIWQPSTDSDLTVNVYLDTSLESSVITNIKDLLSDKFPCNYNGFLNKTHESVIIANSKLHISILKTRLTTANLAGVKEWLCKSPVTIIYELATPIEEVLSTDNYMTYPCHDFNTFCGSIYVGEGRNYIINDNKIPNEDKIIIETEYRKIEGNTKVEDSKYKKCNDGYDTNYMYGKGKNLINPIDFANHVLKCDSSALLIGNILTFTSGNFSQFANVYPLKGLDKNIRLTCSVLAKRESGPGTLYFGFAYDDKSHNTATTDTNDYVKMKATSNPSKNLVGICFSYTNPSSRFSIDLNTIQVELGSQATEYEEFIPTTKYLENTEENDIEDLRHLVSLTGFNYDKVLNESFDKLLNGTL